VRVVLVNDLGWPAGGAEKSVELLKNQLAERGHEVLVVSTDIGMAGRSDGFADVVVPAITGNPLRRLAGKAFHVAAYRRVRALIRVFQPDVVHFHTIGELSPSVVAAAAGVPHVVTVHGPEDYTLALLPWQLPPSDYRNGTYRPSDLRAVGRLRYCYLRFIERPIYQCVLRRTFAYVAPSRFLADTLLEDAAPTQIRQVYNGIELLPPAPVQPGRDRTLLYVGRLEAVKGCNILLRAFELVRREVPDARLVLVGDGGASDDLHVLAAEAGVADAVEFRGWLSYDAVGDAIADATAVVIPSVWPETLATVALEALAVGRPLIGSRVGGLPELIDDGVNGFLVEPYDVRRLADRMAAILTDPVMAERMGAAGRRRSGSFEIDRFTGEIEQLYTEAVEAA
jgi:glycosyltransferase involved in cell wall biosynthesis